MRSPGVRQRFAAWTRRTATLVLLGGVLVVPGVRALTNPTRDPRALTRQGSTQDSKQDPPRQDPKQQPKQQPKQESKQESKPGDKSGVEKAESSTDPPLDQTDSVLDALRKISGQQEGKPAADPQQDSAEDQPATSKPAAEAGQQAPTSEAADPDAPLDQTEAVLDAFDVGAQPPSRDKVPPGPPGQDLLPPPPPVVPGSEQDRPEAETPPAAPGAVPETTVTQDEPLDVSGTVLDALQSAQEKTPSTSAPAQDGSLNQTDLAAGALKSRAATGASPLDQPPDSTLPVHGALSLDYRRRDEKDFGRSEDLSGTLALDVGDADRQPFTAHLFLRSATDLDGDRSGDVYYGLDDTYDGWFTHVYEASLDVHCVEALPVFRLGRQLDYETPVVAHFDGARLQTAEIGPFGVQAGGFVGVPVRLYESPYPDAWMAGVHASARPWTGARARVEWMQVDENPSGLEPDVSDDLYAVTLTQRFAQHHRVSGQFTWLGGHSRDWRLRADSFFPDQGLQVNASYYEQLQTLRFHSDEFDPYTIVLGEYRPYRQVQLAATKDLGDHFQITAGTDVRRLRHDGDEGTYNHEFERYYVAPTLRGWPDERLSIGASADWWRSDDDDISSLNGDVSYELVEDFEATVGTGYALYEYDLFTGHERDHVRTYYVRLDYDWRHTVRLRADYTYEDNDIGAFHQLRAGFTWTF